jgi:hypothetical protein
MDLRGPVTDEMLEALRERNAAAAKKKIVELGEKWVLARNYAPTRRYTPVLHKITNRKVAA